MDGPGLEPGWYDAPDGRQRWWDGTTWGPAKDDPGQPSEQKPQKKNDPRDLAVGAVALAVIALVVASCSGMLSGGSEPRGESSFEAYVACQGYVRRELAPTSVSFPPTNQATIRLLDSGDWSVTAWAEGRGRHPFMCTATYNRDGDSWDVTATIGG